MRTSPRFRLSPQLCYYSLLRLAMHTPHPLASWTVGCCRRIFCSFLQGDSSVNW